MLRFPWHTKEDVDEALLEYRNNSEKYGKGSDEQSGSDSEFVEIQLEGGGAFGTGEHPTTQLCLSWVKDVVVIDTNNNNNKDNDDNNKDKNIVLHPIQTLLDYGTGSGVLGIAACALRKNDVNFKVVGVDVDVDCIRIANHNAHENEVSNGDDVGSNRMVSYLPRYLDESDDVSTSLAMKSRKRQQQQSSSLTDAPEVWGSELPSSSLSENEEDGTTETTVTRDEILPQELDGPIYDACVANILADPLIMLSKRLAGMIRPGGRIGLSGILSEQGEEVVEAYLEYFDDVKVAHELNGWVLVTGTRKRKE